MLTGLSTIPTDESFILKESCFRRPDSEYVFYSVTTQYYTEGYIIQELDIL